MRPSLATLSLSAAVSLLACQEAKQTPAPESSKPQAQPAAQPGTQQPPAQAAQASASKECMAPWEPSGEPEVIEAGGKSFKLTGTLLEETSKDDDDQIVFGVVADIKEDTEENLANLGALLKFFKDKGAEIILVAGDLGDSQQQIEHVLDKLAGAGLPVLTVIGNRESVRAYTDAVAAVHGKHANVVNLNQARLVKLDDAAIISVPGYHNKVYVHAKDGCTYSPGDLAASKPIVEAAGGKTLLAIGHGPPLQTGTEALDRTLEQVNVGSPSLASFLAETGIRFGVFANIHEAGGRATDLAGEKLVPQHTLAESLYLNPGPADSVQWKMNDGTESRGMGAILTIKGRQASYEVLRIGEKG